LTIPLANQLIQPPYTTLMTSPVADTWPTPVFEGSEKRLEVDFLPTAGSGLRSLNRSQLDQLLEHAGCSIVSDRHNEQFDAYVLSESSLFVFSHKIVLKTCGTTKILHAIPLLLQLAGSTGCSPKRCKYSRASFLYPHHQVLPCLAGHCYVTPLSFDEIWCAHAKICLLMLFSWRQCGMQPCSTEC